MATLKNTTTNTTSSIKLPVGTNSDRPSSPSIGMMRFNTDIETVEIFDGSNWSRMGYSQSVNLANVPATLNETTNRTANITVNATGYPGGTTLYWTITGEVDANDFSQGFDGSFTLSGDITGSTGNITIEVEQDFTPEGPENFQIEIRTGSTSGPIIETSSTITIEDTSNEPPTEIWTPDIITATGTNSSTQPNICNIYYRRLIMYWVYTASEVSAAFGGATTANISRMRFDVTEEPLYQPLPDYAIGMKQGSFSVSTNPGNTGYTIVKNQNDENFPVGTKTFLFDTPFNWTGQDLVIAIAYGQVQPTWNSSGQSAIGSGTSYWDRSDSAGTYVINTDSANSSNNFRPVVQLYG